VNYPEKPLFSRICPRQTAVTEAVCVAAQRAPGP
jgi:hypothetical protein